MSRRKPPGVKEDVTCNLIPMIDIMFLLLLFFMLGADMGHRELESVVLPKADHVTKDEFDDKEGRLTINAHHRENIPCSLHGSKQICRSDAHWEIAFRGKDCTDPDVLTLALKGSVSGRPDDPLESKRVMIRADAGAPYGLAQRAMNVCAKNGIYKVEVGAAKPKRD